MRDESFHPCPQGSRMVVVTKEEFTLPAARDEISSESCLAGLPAALRSQRRSRAGSAGIFAGCQAGRQLSRSRHPRVYTDNVWKLLILSTTAMVLCSPALCRQNPDATPQAQTLRAGVLVPHETCVAKPDQSYALYLPSHYTPGKRWPVIYVFD